jgi:hypothetical protein
MVMMFNRAALKFNRSARRVASIEKACYFSWHWSICEMHNLLGTGLLLGWLSVLNSGISVDGCQLRLTSAVSAKLTCPFQLSTSHFASTSTVSLL